MAKFVIVAVALVASVAYVADAAMKRPMCPGCIFDQDPSKFPDLMNKLKAVLATIHADTSVDEIISYKTQVVAGLKNIVEYKDKNKKKCTASWVNQPWISPRPQYVTLKC